MDQPQIDVLYARALLGIQAEATMGSLRDALTEAIAYRFISRERMEMAERLSAYLAARSRFGSLSISFNDIRKTYHKMAMALHPDRQQGAPAAEDDLKAINIAYALIEDMHREAGDYFRLADAYRRESEDEAVKAHQLEHQAATGKNATSPGSPSPPRNPAQSQSHRQPRKYLAASVPRYIRNARLSHVPINQVIGSWHIDAQAGIKQVFDVIMLPEAEFMRMKLHLSTASVTNPALQPGSITPPYILKDTKEVLVPADETQPGSFAKKHFLEAFRLPPSPGMPR